MFLVDLICSGVPCLIEISLTQLVRFLQQSVLLHQAGRSMALSFKLMLHGIVNQVEHQTRESDGKYKRYLVWGLKMSFPSVLTVLLWFISVTSTFESIFVFSLTQEQIE